MYEKAENNQTWFTIDCPKDHSILHQPLFAFFFLSMLFFQEKVVWESELKEDLGKLKELEGR